MMKVEKFFIVVAIVCSGCTSSISSKQSYEWKVIISSKYSDQGDSDDKRKEFVVPLKTQYKFDFKGSTLNCILDSDEENLGFRSLDCGIFSVIAGCNMKVIPNMILLDVPVGRNYVHSVKIMCE